MFIHNQRNWVAKAVIACLAILFVAHKAPSLEIPFLSNIRNLSEKASDEIREEERVSEVLNQDASYRSLFDSVSNPDIPIHRYVKPGEELKYQALFRGLPAGTVRLSAKRLLELKKRPVFAFEVNFETNDFLGSLYAINTNINSFVDAETGRSYLIRRKVSERNRSYKDRLEFKYDHIMDNGIVDPVSKYSMVGDNGKEIASLPFPIPGNMRIWFPSSTIFAAWISRRSATAAIC